jgi:hypothetical protein
MNVNISYTEKGWIVTDLDAQKSKAFNQYPSLKDIEEFVEENKK